MTKATHPNTHLQKHTCIQNLPYIHTAHKRLPLKHAGVKLDEVPSEFISKPLWKWKDVITDATRTSIKISQVSQRSRNVQSANHFQTKFLVAFMEKQKRYFVKFVLKPRAPNFSSIFERVQSAMLIPAIPSVPNPNNPTVLETWYSGGGKGKISLDVNGQTLYLRDLYREEEIAGLIVLGSCLWSPEGFVNQVNSGTDEGIGAPFRQAAVRAPLIIWSGPDCSGAGGRYIRRVWGRDPFQLTGLLRLQHTFGLKIDSPLLCILSLADFIPDFIRNLHSCGHKLFDFKLAPVFTDIFWWQILRVCLD